MSRPHLKDSTILVVEHEPMIVMGISMAFEGTGACPTTTNTVKHARLLVEHDGLSAAILDHALSDGDSKSLCTRLIERRIPFLMYSGYASLDGPCKDAPYLARPAADEDLLDAMESLIRDAKIA